MTANDHAHHPAHHPVDHPVDAADEKALPRRHQRRRIAGWTAPEGAIYVGRGSAYGNPFRYRDPSSGLVRTFPANPGVIEHESRISADGARHDLFLPDPTNPGGPDVIERCEVRWATRAELVELFRRTLLEPDRGMLMGWPSRGGHYASCTVELIQAELAGRDLVCRCPIEQPCHADVLLAIANGTEPPRLA